MTKLLSLLIGALFIIVLPGCPSQTTGRINQHDLVELSAAEIILLAQTITTEFNLNPSNDSESNALTIEDPEDDCVFTNSITVEGGTDFALTAPKGGGSCSGTYSSQTNGTIAVDVSCTNYRSNNDSTLNGTFSFLVLAVSQGSSLDIQSNESTLKIISGTRACDLSLNFITTLDGDSTAAISGCITLDSLTSKTDCNGDFELSETIDLL